MMAPLASGFRSFGWCLSMLASHALAELDDATYEAMLVRIA